MCSQWGISGNFVGGSVVLKHDLSFDEWKKIIDDVATFKPVISLWGGEPFLYRHIIELIAYIKRKGLPCYMYTNGVLLRRYAQDLVELDFDGVTISIDGPREIHDSIRGLPGGFDAAIAGIEELRTLRDKKSAKMTITMNSVISGDNYRYIKDMVAVGERAQVDMIALNLVLFITTEMGREYQFSMKTTFGCDAQMWKGWVDDEVDVDTRYITKAIQRLGVNGLSRKPPILFMPNIRVTEIDTFFRQPEKRPNYTRCFQPYFEANILPNGDMHFCHEFQEYVLGNLLEADFATIWNSPKARAFRRYLQKNLFPICGKCCRLYVYPLNRFIPANLTDSAVDV